MIGKDCWRCVTHIVMLVFLGLAPAALHAQELPQVGGNAASSSTTKLLQSRAQAAAPGSAAQPTIASPGVVVGVSLGEIYVNNVRLAASAGAQESSYITQIEPFVRAARKGPRLSGFLNYSLAAYAYRGHTQTHQVAQRLHASGTFTFIPKHFFLDGLATYSRQIVNNQLPAGTGSYLLNNNQANSGVAVLSPYWVQDLGTLGTMEARYSRGRIVYNTRGIPGQSSTLLNGIPDATSNGVLFGLQHSKSGFWNWSLSYARQRIEPDFGPGQEFEAAKFGLGLQVSRELELLADAGKENRYLPNGTFERLGARFWDAGFSWGNSLDHFKVLVGHRFYGHSYSVTWTHEAALLVTTLGYREETTSLSQRLLSSNPTDEVLLPLAVPRVPSLYEFQPYLSKRASASITYTGPNDTLMVNLYDERRSYFSSDLGSERILDSHVSWLFNIGVFTTLTPSFNWRRYRFQSGQVSYGYRWELTLVHQFGLRNTGSLVLRRQVSNIYSGVPGAHSYRVNIIYLQWTHLF